jgi:threonine synthase
MLNKKISVTPLVRANKLGKLIGIPNIYFKLEGKNISGTFKDRAAVMLVKDAIKKGYRGITVGTCGNMGMSIIMASPIDFVCEIFIPQQYKGITLTNKLLKTKKINLHFVEGTYEDAVLSSIKFSQKMNVYNANPYGHSAKLSIYAYSNISREIVSQLGKIPNSVWMSVGNGTGISGIYNGFKKCRVFPKICAVSSKGNNAITQSIVRGLPIVLDPNTLVETIVNEPLLNWKSSQIQEAFNAVSQTKGIGVEITDDEMIRAQNMLKKYENINTIPAAAAAFAGLMKNYNKFELTGHHVVILTA